MAVVVVVKTCLVACLLLEIMPDNQSQLHEEVDGIVECCPADPEEILLHLGAEFLQCEMPVNVVYGIEYGISLRGFPAIVLLQVVGQCEPYSLQNIVIHLIEGVACGLQNYSKVIEKQNKWAVF